MTPLIYQWDGEALRPIRRFEKAANEQFVVGEQYHMDVVNERSRETHSHYFAVVANAWANLPEEWGDRFANSEHLRKWCLIRAGLRTERSIACGSHADALRVAAFAREIDEYAVVVVSGNLVTQYAAKSQSLQTMSRNEFQESKEKVFDVLAKMLGTSPTELGKTETA